jgi:hypothetical protein
MSGAFRGHDAAGALRGDDAAAWLLPGARALQVTATIEVGQEWGPRSACDVRQRSCRNGCGVGRCDGSVPTLNLQACFSFGFCGSEVSIFAG